MDFVNGELGDIAPRLADLKQLNDGIHLIYLIACLANYFVIPTAFKNFDEIESDFDRRANLSLAFQLLAELGIVTDGIKVDHFLTSNEKRVLRCL
jgi:hypothetical protein